MKKINLSGKLGVGKYAIVDDKNFDYLNKWSWHYVAGGKNSTTGYAGRNVHIQPRPDRKTRKIYMHREIVKMPSGYICDHINRNTLDNRSENLRIATKSSNACNTKKPKTSKYYGVCFNKKSKKWIASAWNKKSVYLGSYDREDAAAIAFNKYSLNRYGSQAVINLCNEK